MCEELVHSVVEVVCIEHLMEEGGRLVTGKSFSWRPELLYVEPWTDGACEGQVTRGCCLAQREGSFQLLACHVKGRKWLYSRLTDAVGLSLI